MDLINHMYTGTKVALKSFKGEGAQIVDRSQGIKRVVQDPSFFE